MTDEQQVAIAKTLGNIVQNEGEGGIYKISLDKDVNQRAEYLKGSMFWHFDGSLQPYPNLAAVLRAIKLSEPVGRPSSATPTRHTTTCRSPTRRPSPTSVVHSAEHSQYYVRPR